ncbi:hypothetical protein HDU81_003131 [Chytriomyces hyalinus]|nr:hypothetical protein HDU81_003131 [Chytriomyces hyalinus]
MRSRTASASSQTSSQILDLSLVSPWVQVEPVSAQAQASGLSLRSFICGQVQFTVDEMASSAVQIDVIVTGLLNVNTSKLALGWIKGGAARPRGAASLPAEPISRKVVSRTETIWQRKVRREDDADADCSSDGLLAEPIPFKIDLSSQSPSSMKTEFYSIDYSVCARVTLRSEDQSHPKSISSRAVPFTVSSVRTDASSMPDVPLQAALESLDETLESQVLHPVTPFQTPLKLEEPSPDGCVLVTISRKEGKEVVLPVSAFSTALFGCLAPHPSLAPQVQYVNLEAHITLTKDVDRIYNVKASLKQKTHFRFVALKEDLVGGSVQQEQARIDQVRQIGESITVHVPLATRTLSKAPVKSLNNKAMKPKELQLNLSIETEQVFNSSDILEFYETFPDSTMTTSPVNRSPTSPLKRKFSLPQIEPVDVLSPPPSPVEPTALATASASAPVAPFNPLSFIKKLLPIQEQPANNRPQVRQKISRAVSAHCLSQRDAPLVYIASSSNTSPQTDLADATTARTILITLRVPIYPKDNNAKSEFLPSSRLQEVIRSHFVSVRVEYHLKKEKVAGTGLRVDRHLDIQVPLKRITSRAVPMPTFTREEHKILFLAFLRAPSLSELKRKAAALKSDSNIAAAAIPQPPVLNDADEEEDTRHIPRAVLHDEDEMQKPARKRMKVEA